MKIQNISFLGQPKNYKKIDATVSRSAQPNLEDYGWLKENGVTDVVNFRTLYGEREKDIEKNAVEKLGMRYHQISSVTAKPNENNIKNFLSIIDDVKARRGKVHIHCKAGADRTGMYAYIYKSLNNISTQANNLKEWLTMGHNVTLYPNLMDWTIDFVKKFKIKR